MTTIKSRAESMAPFSEFTDSVWMTILTSVLQLLRDCQLSETRSRVVFRRFARGKTPFYDRRMRRAVEKELERHDCDCCYDTCCDIVEQLRQECQEIDSDEFVRMLNEANALTTEEPS